MDGVVTKACYNVTQRKANLTTMSTLTIRLDDKLERELARAAEQSGRTKSEIAREAVRRQLAVQGFRELRQQLTPYAEAAGWLTDEDVFRDVS